MVDYPNIPLPSTSLSERVETTTLRTRLGTGLARQRSRFPTGTRDYRVSWILTKAELALFESWYITDLGGGVLSFTMPWDYADGRIYRFTEGRYTARQDHGRVSVSATLECLDVFDVAANDVPVVPPWKRLSIDPVADQQLGLAHRNARLASRPDDGDTRTLRIYNPLTPEVWIYFGIRNLGEGETLVTSVDADDPPILPAASWPSGLPLPLTGFTDSTERQVSRLEMDSGHPRQSRRFEATEKTYSVSWDMSAAQVASFEAFYFATLRNGSRPFSIVLPVDNQFVPVACRFVGGYVANYQPIDRFRISATLERITTQPVAEDTENRFGLYYAPFVDVSEHYLVKPADAGKFFRVTTTEGNTVNLHIGSQLIEFGLLVLGPGSVLITRTPFVHDMGSDSTEGSLLSPRLELRSVEVDLGPVESIDEDETASSIALVGLALESVVVSGEMPDDATTSSIALRSMELKEVQVIISPDSDATTSEIQKPSFSLQIP